MSSPKTAAMGLVTFQANQLRSSEKGVLFTIIEKICAIAGWITPGSSSHLYATLSRLQKESLTDASGPSFQEAHREFVEAVIFRMKGTNKAYPLLPVIRQLQSEFLGADAERFSAATDRLVEEISKQQLVKEIKKGLLADPRANVQFVGALVGGLPNSASLIRRATKLSLQEIKKEGLQVSNVDFAKRVDALANRLTKRMSWKGFFARTAAVAGTAALAYEGYAYHTKGDTPLTNGAVNLANSLKAAYNDPQETKTYVMDNYITPAKKWVEQWIRTESSDQSSKGASASNTANGSPQPKGNPA